MDDELDLPEPDGSADPAPGGWPSPRRILLGAGLLAVLGIAAGALAGRGVGRLLALPEGAEVPTYADAEPPPKAAGTDAASPVPATSDTEEPSTEAPERPVAPRALPKASYVDTIVKRNIFDSTAVYNPAAAVVGDGTCRNDAAVRLLATIVAEPETYSSALIAQGTGKDGKAEGYAIGDDVSGGGRIARIEQKKVCMEDGTCICIGEQGAPLAQGAPAGNAAADGQVEKLGDNKFVVDKSLLDGALGNLESFAGQLRVVPHKDASGNIDGFRLSAIRKGSLFEKLGIKNGDILHAVNGSPLTSTEGALSLYQSLRNERSFNFDISRRNTRQSLEYEVR